MRLSAHVSQHGIDAFTFEDFLFVGGKVTVDPSRLVLVGGQAIEAWGHVFNVPSPLGPDHPLTEDVDWLGGKKDAQWLCKLLGDKDTELTFATVDDNTPNSAIAYLRRPDGRVLMIDFLRSILGPSSEEVQSLAVPVRIAGGVTLHVLHPLLCLESRFANLQLLESKRRGNGPVQARWALSIAEAFLKQLTSSNSPVRQRIRSCHRIAECAEYKHGRFCYLEFDLDPLAVVTPDVVTAIGGRFASEDWPRTVARIQEKRERWIAHKEKWLAFDRQRGAAAAGGIFGEAKPQVQAGSNALLAGSPPAIKC